MIAIDGACRGNGQADCLSVGAAYAVNTDKVFFKVEYRSTNQRGELYALLDGLTIGEASDDPLVYIVTDSEYILNTINKEWYKNWENKGWVTADNNPVKNRDLWEQIVVLIRRLEGNGKELMIYHVKGHVLSLGKATARKILETAGYPALHRAASLKYDEVRANPNKCAIIDEAMKTFERINGFAPPVDIFREMIICNTVADVAAGYYIDFIKADYAG